MRFVASEPGAVLDLLAPEVGDRKHIDQFAQGCPRFHPPSGKWERQLEDRISKEPIAKVTPIGGNESNVGLIDLKILIP